MFFRKNWIHVIIECSKKLLIHFEQFGGWSKLIFRTVWSHMIIISKKNLVGSKVNLHSYASCDYWVYLLQLDQKFDLRVQNQVCYWHRKHCKTFDTWLNHLDCVRTLGVVYEALHCDSRCTLTLSSKGGHLPRLLYILGSQSKFRIYSSAMLSTESRQFITNIVSDHFSIFKLGVRSRLVLKSSARNHIIQSIFISSRDQRPS